MHGMIIYIKGGGALPYPFPQKKIHRPTNGGGPPPSSSASRSHSGKVRFTTSLTTAGGLAGRGWWVFFSKYPRKTNGCWFEPEKYSPFKRKRSSINFAGSMLVFRGWNCLEPKRPIFWKIQPIKMKVNPAKETGQFISRWENAVSLYPSEYWRWIVRIVLLMVQKSQTTTWDVYIPCK